MLRKWVPIMIATISTAWGYTKELPGPVLVTIFLVSLTALLGLVALVQMMLRGGKSSRRWKWWSKESPEDRRKRRLAANETVLVFTGMASRKFGEIVPGDNPLQLQVALIENVQTAVDNSATNVTADIEYRHASGKVYQVKKAAWLQDYDFCYTELINANSHGKLVILVEPLKRPEGQRRTFCASFNDNRHRFPLDVGRWNWTITISYDNSEPLILTGDLTILPDDSLSAFQMVER
jgi:hypothetical protein